MKRISDIVKSSPSVNDEYPKTAEQISFKDCIDIYNRMDGDDFKSHREFIVDSKVTGKTYRINILFHHPNYGKDDVDLLYNVQVIEDNNNESKS